MNLLLTRIKTSDMGTFGKLAMEGTGDFFTGELPWRDNQSDISCVPVGTYTCEWLISPKHPDGKYHLTNVPGRDAVEIHSGNFCGDVSKGFKSDVLGCLLLGNLMGEVDGQTIVSDSKNAVNRFETFMAQQPFTLQIQEAF